jgi:hypothetical protein
MAADGTQTWQNRGLRLAFDPNSRRSAAVTSPRVAAPGRDPGFDSGA